MSKKSILYGGRRHKVFTIDTEYGKFDAILTEERYLNGGALAVEALVVEDGAVVEPFATLTVNLDGEAATAQDAERAYLDTNNNPWAPEFVTKNGIARPTVIAARSGFCTYPLFLWDTTKFYEQ